VCFPRKAGEIFCQTHPLTMKKTSQNTANDGINVNPLMRLNACRKHFRQIKQPFPSRSNPFNTQLPLKGFITVKTRFIKAFARFERHNLVQPTTPSRLDFLPNFPLTMKSISQNTARPDFRPCEIRGQQLCRRGWLGPVGLVVAARLNRLPGKFCERSQSTLPGGVGYVHWKSRPAFQGQGHCHNYFLGSKDILPQKRHFSRVLPGLGRYNFVPPVNKAIENFRQTRPVNKRKEPKNTAKTPGKPLPKPGDRAGGFRDFGSAANFLPSLQRLSAVSGQSSGHDENNFRPTGGAENQNAFCDPDTSLPVSLLAGFPLDGRIDGQNEKTLCFILKPSLLKNS
jgi:hypothetical protein